jgi:hypothetical protein
MWKQHRLQNQLEKEIPSSNLPLQNGMLWQSPTNNWE